MRRYQTTFKKEERVNISTFLINQTGEGLAKTTTTTTNNKQIDPTSFSKMEYVSIQAICVKCTC